MGEGVHGHEEGELALTQLEEGAGPDGAGQQGITDQGPPLHLSQLPVVLEIYIGGSKIRLEVTLVESSKLIPLHVYLSKQYSIHQSLVIIT